MGTKFGLIVISQFLAISSRHIDHYKLNKSELEIDVHSCISQVTSTFCYARGMICVATSCVCHGKIKHGKCIHSDHCENNVCPEETSFCINYLTFYECICNYGFKKSSTEESCIDENECLTGRNICVENEDCINTIGSYKCVCMTGYESDEDEEKCIDIDECKQTDVCSNNAQCMNTEGSYKCICIVGYAIHPNNSGSCIDIDECALFIHQCRRATTDCINTDGSYVCRCRGHHYPSSDTNCIGIGQYSICNMGYDECDLNTTECKDEEENYSCPCLIGFKKGRSKDPMRCIDMDECQESIDACDKDSTNCINNSGSYYCECLANLYRITAKKCSDPAKGFNNTEMVFPEFLRKGDNLIKRAIYIILVVAWTLILLRAVYTLITQEKFELSISHKTINKKHQNKIKMKNNKKRKHIKAEKK